MKRKGASEETPWKDASKLLPRDPGLYLCLCCFNPIGGDKNALIFPEIIAYKMKESEISFRTPQHVKILYWMSIPTCPQQQSFL